MMCATDFESWLSRRFSVLSCQGRSWRLITFLLLLREKGKLAALFVGYKSSHIIYNQYL